MGRGWAVPRGTAAGIDAPYFDGGGDLPCHLLEIVGGGPPPFISLTCITGL
jgi:hypothetical protein